MNASGSVLLAARVRAGVRIGATIELEGDVAGSELRAGDRGVVRDIAVSGAIFVAWESGATGEIDPGRIAFRRLAA